MCHIPDLTSLHVLGDIYILNTTEMPEELQMYIYNPPQ